MTWKLLHQGFHDWQVRAYHSLAQHTLTVDELQELKVDLLQTVGGIDREIERQERRGKRAAVPKRSATKREGGAKTLEGALRQLAKQMGREAERQERAAEKQKEGAK